MRTSINWKFFFNFPFCYSFINKLLIKKIGQSYNLFEKYQTINKQYII